MELVIDFEAKREERANRILRLASDDGNLPLPAEATTRCRLQEEMVSAEIEEPWV